MSTPAIPRIEAEVDPNVTPLPSHTGKNTFFARLRAGMHIQVGADPNDKDSFIYGPADLPVTPVMAIAHMAKWEDPNAVKKWLAASHPKHILGKPHLHPMKEKRLTPRERMDRDVASVTAMNNGPAPGPKGVSMDEVKEMVRASLKPLQAQMNQILAALGGPEGDAKKNGGSE